MSLVSFCQKRLIKVTPDSTIAEACHLMEHYNVGCLIAEQEGKLCGIVTDRDIALKVTGAQRNPGATRVNDIMSRDPVRISVNSDVHQLTALMHAYHIRRVPIVDGSETPLGIVTMDDLVTLLSNEMAEIGKAISEEFPRGNA